MQPSRKETAWKKSRKFGDVKGGRSRVKLEDNLIRRYHSLDRPSPNDELPIYLQDNPSRDFFHPLEIADIQAFLSKVEEPIVKQITHIWLRKVKKSDFEKGETYQACFIKGSGVNLIVLNSFPKDLRMVFGKKKPSTRSISFFEKWDNEWEEENGQWYLKWSTIGIKNYYQEYLLLHEIGHLVESQYKEYYSAANRKRREDFADNYATIWNNKLKTVIEFK